MVGTPYTIGAHVSAPATVRWTCTSRLRCPAAAAVVSKKKPRKATGGRQDSELRKRKATDQEEFLV